MKPEAQLHILLSALADGPKSSADLRRQLGDISPATLSRLVARLGQQVAVLGQSRATQYARLRDVRGSGRRFPLYRVDDAGNVHRFGMLLALSGGSFWWQPVTAGVRGVLYRHLPWFIQDMRPDGFIGRAFVGRVGSDLGLPSRLPDWSDDHVLVALARRGDDAIGDLIVGEESLARYLEKARQALPITSPDDYPRLAAEAMAGDPAGSSAAGEQPKFSTLCRREQQVLPVMVKFSPLLSSSEGVRWSDLLVCEHLALEVIQEAGISAARSRIVCNGGRTFLEVERFDRCALTGRLPVHGLGVIDDEYFGSRDTWSAMARRLEEAAMMSPEDSYSLEWLDLFGALIGNTDRHFGNISVVPLDAGRSRFCLAPAYDMLPMCYRPRSGEEPPVSLLSPPAITTAKVDLADSAMHSAMIFWQRAADDERISAPFRRICNSNREIVGLLGNSPRVVG